MQHIYDEEQDKIVELGRNLQEKYNFVLRRMDRVPMTKKNNELLTIWHDEVVDKFQRLGFIVECDITPALAGIGTPTIDVIDRVDKHEFDFEKKSYEVEKNRETGKKHRY